MTHGGLAPRRDWCGALAESDLSTRAKTVGWALSNYMNALGGSAFPSLLTLAANCSYTSKGPVIEGLRELQERGFLLRTPGGGRGHSTLYEARFPASPETVAEPDPFPGGSASGEGSEGANAASLTAAGPVAPPTPHTTGERVALDDPLSKERVGKGSGKGGPTRPEVVKRYEDPAAASARASAELAEGVGRDAAAASLAGHLAEVGAGAQLTALAWTDPERAIAWFQLAQDEARSNPAGFVAAGLRGGEWPSSRESLTSTGSKERWLQHTVPLLVAEAAHEIVDEWELEPGETVMWHQAVDEALERAAAQRAADRGEAAA